MRSSRLSGVCSPSLSRHIQHGTAGPIARQRGCPLLGRCYRCGAEFADVCRSINSQLLTILARAAAHRRADTDSNDGLATAMTRRSATRFWWCHEGEASRSSRLLRELPDRQVLRPARLDVALARALARVGLERISCSVLSGPPRRSQEQALEKSHLATSSAQSSEIKVRRHQIGSQRHHTYANADPERFRRIVPHTQDVRLCCAQRHCERAQVGGVEQAWQCALRRYARIRSHLAVDNAPPHNGQTNKK